MTQPRYHLQYLLALVFTLSLHQYAIASKNLNHSLVVSSIIITGNTITNKRIILRELTFKLGDTIMLKDVPTLELKSRENLENIRLFNFVSIDVEIESGSIFWIIEVEERWYIWPFPIFEYADRNLSTFLKSGDYSRVNYGGYIRVDNFRGMREQIKIRMVLGYRKQVALQYFTQNLDREKRHGLSAWISYYTNHEVPFTSVNNKPVYYYSVNGPARQVFFADLTYQYRPQHYWYHTITLGTVHSNIADSVNILNPNYFGDGNRNFWHTQIKYEATLDKRNSKLFPLAGYLIKMEFAKQGLFKGESLNLWYTKLTGGIYPQITNRLYSGVDIMTKLSSQTNLPYYMNEAIGFQDYIRGYEYYVTHGSTFLINKNSLKLAVLPTKVVNLPLIPEGKFKKAHLALYWSLFADTGYVKPDTQTPHQNLEGKFIYGYGTGLYVVAYYDVVFRLEYSMNIFGERGIFAHFGTPFLNN